MAFTYSDYRGYPITGGARKARLALYLQELEDALESRSIAVGSDGKSLSREGILELIRMKTDEYDALPGSGGSFGKIRRQ